MNPFTDHQDDQNIVAATKPRLLLIAYSFPPVGGAGVQRPVKWVKNLVNMGWDVTVLTTANPSVPTRDESLLTDIPDDVLVLRAKTWEPDYRFKQGLVAPSQSMSLFSRSKSTIRRLVRNIVQVALQPDPQILWVPNAIREGRRILRELTHDVILVTAPAYSSFFIGTHLKRSFGLPLVLDFRDEWDMSGRYLENAQRDGFSRYVQDRMQNHVLKQADAVVATTVASTANLAGKLFRLKKTATRTVTIYNGFDEEDFLPNRYERRDHATANGNQTSPNPSDFDEKNVSVAESEIQIRDPLRQSKSKVSQNRFRLLYTGTLWNLTTIEPLVQAILKLNESAPQLLERLELVCVGRKTAEQNAHLECVRKTRCHLDTVDYCEHSKILSYLRSTDAVCLLLSDVPGAERVVPGKLFEYLANRKEMLAIVPPGETANIVQRFYPQGHIEPKNIEGIVKWLVDRLSKNSESGDLMAPIAEINEFSRSSQTRRLVELLDDLVHFRGEKNNITPSIANSRMIQS